MALETFEPLCSSVVRMGGEVTGSRTALALLLVVTVAGCAATMRLLMSDQQLHDWVFEICAPSDLVECRSIDSETVL